MTIHHLEFSINIPAARETIWSVLWDEAAYRDWVSVFQEGSHVITDHWKEGSRVFFLSPDKSGIYSTIVKHVPNEIMHFRHLGLVKNGKEQPMDAPTRKWSGTNEIYRLSESEGGLKLTVEIDVLEEHRAFMEETFPKALKRIRKNSCL
ncbi:hypothetical protein [Robiginitalea sp. IMCC43444]|uniref:hypothetical protein n=1 Tax=Robiginitalea sp. IMCC43444 TaxID=3459121 RepID=UPI0040425A2A